MVRKAWQWSWRRLAGPIAPAGKNRAAAHCCPLLTLLTQCQTPAYGPDNQEGSLISMPRGYPKLETPSTKQACPEPCLLSDSRNY